MIYMEISFETPNKAQIKIELCFIVHITYLSVTYLYAYVTLHINGQHDPFI